MMTHTFLKSTGIIVCVLTCGIHDMVYSQQIEKINSTFYRFRVDVDLVPSHRPWTDRSIISCWETALRLFPKLTIFKFNSETRDCTPGLNFNASRQRQVREDEIYIKSECDADNGFQLTHFGETTACLRIFHEALSYTEADSSCVLHRAFLMSVKHVDKIQMIKQEDADLWVGADDIQTEGEFVWKEDSTVLTEDLMVRIFGYGEPNNVNGKEDCVQYRRDKLALNDQDCSDRIAYVCEQRIQLN